MLKPQESSNTLLTSRLKEKGKQKTGVQRNQLRPREDVQAQVPDYDLVSDSSEKKPRRSLLTYTKDRKSKVNLKEKITAKQEPAPDPIDAVDYDEAINLEAYEKSQAEERRRERSQKVSKMLLAALIMLCLYIAFLIYGLIGTNYVYNDLGQVEPEILTVTDLQTLNEYNKLSSYYLRTRILYEKILSLDYELTLPSSNMLQLSMAYSKLLKDVSKLSTDINAAQLDIGYMEIKNQMYELVYTHIAVYLQNIAGAITNNDSEKANQALQGREVIAAEFATLTSNMATLCDTTKGSNNQEIFTWSPENYLDGLKGGKA